jgi:long-chain acyl-CoA synthetase
MRILVTGGSRFDPAVGDALYGMGFDLLQAYGLTECTGGGTVTRPGEPWTGSVGKPLPGVEVRIQSAEAHGGAANGEGEVLIRGPIVMQGYYNQPEANAETLREGWLHTGDLGRLDDNGHLFITGRKKDVIVLGSGKNIYPEDVEVHYSQSPYIKELCVVGLSRAGEPASERLHAVVVPDFDVLREQQIVNAREILRFEIETLTVQLPSHMRVMSLDVWQEDLPRTTTRKLKRFEILERLRGRAVESPDKARERPFAPEEAAWATDPAVAPVLQAITQITSAQQLRPGDNLELDLGLDSMERVELLTHLERVFGRSISDEVSSRIYTVGELVSAVQAGQPATPAAASHAPLPWDVLLHGKPAEDPAFAALLRPRPVLNLALFLVIKSVYLAAWLLFRLRVSGRDDLPRSGPFLLCPNHQSYVDPFLVVSALPFRIVRDVFFVGATEYFASPLMQRIARLIHLIPVDPDSNLVRAMQAGAFGLRHGKVLVLFPEGERSIDGSVRRFKKGASILATHLQVPVVPVALDGLFEVWPRGKRFQRLGRVRMHFGEPLPPPEQLASAAEPHAREQHYAAAVEALRNRVEDLWQSLRLGKGAQETAGG